MKTTPSSSVRLAGLRPVFRALALLAAFAFAALAMPGRALAQSLAFTDPLTGPSSPNLTIPAGYSYTAQGLQRTRSPVSRSLVKTVSGTHLTATQFTAEGSATLASRDIAFVGLGQGVSNPNYGPNEPTNSFVFRIHNLASPSRSMPRSPPAPPPTSSSTPVASATARPARPPSSASRATATA